MNFIFPLSSGGSNPKPVCHCSGKKSLFLLSLLYSGVFSVFSWFSVVSLALAGDPFRTTDPRHISEETELAFKALFEEGNYLQAKEYLSLPKDNNFNDPLAYALRASLAYTEEDWNNLDIYAQKTLDTAQSVVKDDPLRGNLYLAVGNFLMGASEYQKKGALAAITRLQSVFDYFDKAETIDPTDPELNLIKGYLNLFLAVNLPFSNPEQAIANLQTYASPQYLVNRGIALAYRDLKDYELALTFVNKAIESTPLNPELYYLRGQILRGKGQSQNNILILEEAVKNFDIAIAKINQLPLEAVQKPLQREKRKTLEKIEELRTISISN